MGGGTILNNRQYFDKDEELKGDQYGEDSDDFGALNGSFSFT